MAWSSRAGTAFLHAVFFLSGAAGLGYEIVWASRFAVGLGHEIPSVLAVTAAFFAGLALGAWALDRRVASSPRPGAWYAALELVIGAWAALTGALIPRVNEAAAALIGLDPSPLRHWTVAFLLPLATLLPATAAMGATLPAVDRFVERLRRDGRNVGGLYAANTLGAMAGTLACAFVLIPRTGLQATTLILAALNAACGLAVLAGPGRGGRSRAPGGGEEAAFVRAEARAASAGPSAAPADPTRGDIGPRRLAATLVLTGILGIGYEVLTIRVMSQVLENTVYTFAAILSVYLLGAAIGGGAYQLLGRRAPAGPLLGRLVDGLCLACLGGVFVLSRSAAIYAWGRSVFGRDLAGSAAAEGLLAAAALGVPAILMGATFSHLAQSARGAAQGVGRALGLNTLGGALAPFVFGVALLPAAGSRGAMVLLALGYLLLAPGLSWARLGPAAAAILLAWLAPRDLVLVGGVNGGRVLLHREGVMATVAVVDDPEGNLYLKINDLYREGGTRGVFGERRQAHLPLLLHPDPRRALFLGVGTGLTLGAGASHPRLDAVGVELVPEVVGLLDVFHRDEGPLTRRPNVRIAVADARRYARASPGRFDVVVADLFHPARDGSGFLYTREHFGAVKALLAEGGLFCQWLPLYQLDASVARTIVRSFLDVFPEAGALIAHYNALTPALGLVGSSRPLKYRIPYFERRAGDGLAAALDAQRQALYDDFTLFGAIVAGRGDLARFAGPGPLNTDDLPIVRFEAPRFIYAGGGPPYAVLAEILRSLDPDPSAFLESEDPAAAAEFAGRLRRYLAARDRFVEGAVAGLEGRAADMLALYVDSARASPDFETGYALAVHEAAGIAREDPAAARAALRALVEIRPGKSQAAAALRDLFGE